MQTTKTRLYAGSLKGRTLLLPVGNDAIRPTRSAVLQATFDALQSATDLQGKHTLDLCCGAGQWGITALSLGAKHATFVDTAPAFVSQNLESLGLRGQATVLRQDVLHLPDSVWAKADVLFADAPYQALFLPKLLARIGQWLAENPARYAVVEVTPQVVLPEALAPFVHKTKTMGRSKVWILGS